MTTEKQYKVECTEENAPKFLKWVRERGGVALWKSVNLSNPSASWTTPATIRKGDCEGQEGDEIIPYPKPNWQVGAPEVITDAKDIGVYADELYKAIPVALKLSGMNYVLTDGSNRKVKKLLEDCKALHGDSHYKKGVLPDEDHSIGVYYTKSVISLEEWERSAKPAQVEVLA